MSIKRALKDYLSFLRYPTFDYKRDQPLEMSMILKIYGVIYVFMILMMAPISHVMDMENIPHAMEQVMKDMGGVTLFFLVAILVPFLEELIFRLHLRYKPLIFLYMMLLFSTFLFFAFEDISTYHVHDMTKVPDLLRQKFGQYGPFLGFVFISFLVYLFFDKAKESFERLFVDNFGLVFHLSAVIFAAVHIFNFEIDPNKWFLIPLLVMPQFILGLYLGYLRVRNNLWVSIFIHGLNNAIPILLFGLAGLLNS